MDHRLLTAIIYPVVNEIVRMYTRMISRPDELDTTHSYTLRVTTWLTCGWGVLSAYVLCSTLLTSHEVRTMFAASLSLLVVWAVFERKRWGRIALVNMSAVALLFFVGTFAMIIATGARWLQPIERNLGDYLRLSLDVYSADSAAVCCMLALAAVTFVWLRQPDVVAEFEKDKRPRLNGSQFVIARLLVTVWAITIAVMPMTSTDKRVLHSLTGMFSQPAAAFQTAATVIPVAVPATKGPLSVRRGSRAVKSSCPSPLRP